MGVSIAEKTGITLVGFARGNRMNVYSNGKRIRD
jgi:formate dehydrogenase accessory protein FdhD